MGLSEHELAHLLRQNPGIKVREMPIKTSEIKIIDEKKEIKSMSPVTAAPTESKMNKLESAYAYNLDMMKMAGLILEYKYEPFNLRLASPKCYYRIDFLVINLLNEIELHETKGDWVDGDALVKFKVAAESFPFFIFRWITRNKDGTWNIKTLRDGKWSKPE